MSLTESYLRNVSFFIISIFIWGFGQFVIPSGSNFFSTKFVVILLGAILAMLWASAKIRMNENTSMMIYPLSVVAIVAIGCGAKFLITNF